MLSLLIVSNSPVIRYNQLALTILKRCERYTIDSMVYLIGNEADGAIFDWKRDC